MLEKKLYLPLQLQSDSKSRFKVESGLVNKEFKWLILERGTNKVMAYAKKFETACNLRDEFEKRFPSQRLTQEKIDTMSETERPTALHRLIRWTAEKA